MRLLNALKHVLATPTLGTQGEEGYDATRKILRYHDGVRSRGASQVGWQPYAYAIGVTANLAATTNTQLDVNGGTIAVPVMLVGHMLAEQVTFRNSDTTNTRGDAQLSIYEARLNNSATLDRIATGNLAAWSAPSAANKVIPIDSAPVYMAPGLYWIVIRNDNGARGFNIGSIASGTMALNLAQTKTHASAVGSTLDLSTGWTRLTTVMSGIRLEGRTRGESTVL